MLRGSVRANAKVSKADITAVQSFVHYTRFQNFKTFNLKLVHPALVGHLGASYQLTLIVPKHCMGRMYCAITMASVRVEQKALNLWLIKSDLRPSATHP